MKRNVFLTGILAVALVFGLAVTGCDTGDDDGGGNPTPPAASGVDLYPFTEDGGVGTTLYAGNGTAQTVTVSLYVSDTQVSELYTGSISADGKLTLAALPSTVADAKLFPGAGMEMDGVSGGFLIITPSLYLAKDTERLNLLYLDRDVTVEGMSLKKGLNYVSGSGTSLVTDISAYKWVIYQSGE
jgi:hypothetical protein